jgi:hypothetical protein
MMLPRAGGTVWRRVMRRSTATAALVIAALTAVACATAGDPATRQPAAARIVAFGDVHGDLAATRRALRLAGAIDENDRWIGGALVVVQTGDQLDRGDDERAILDLFRRLVRDAARAGGAFHPLNGNHELMNAQLDLRYVTEGGFRRLCRFRCHAAEPRDSLLAAGFPPEQRGRVNAFRPGGPMPACSPERNTIADRRRQRLRPRRRAAGARRVRHRSHQRRDPRMAARRTPAPQPQWSGIRQPHLDSPLLAESRRGRVRHRRREALARWARAA